jgi:hypothetical protein
MHEKTCNIYVFIRSCLVRKVGKILGLMTTFLGGGRKGYIKKEQGLGE